MILLEPANTITHFTVEIKRRTISLTGFLATRVGGCDSHPKMLYRVAAIHRSVTDAGVFPF